MYELIFYDLPASGKYPVDDYLRKLDDETLAEVDTVMGLLKVYGNNLKMPYSRFLRDGIYELRIPTDEKNIRILYFFVIDKKAILTNAFTKKQRETPKDELDKAIKYKKEYLKRSGKWEHMKIL